MEIGSSSGTVQSEARVITTLRLGSEVHKIDMGNASVLSDQLAAMKENCMSILNDFIAKHNAPSDVPDEPIEGASEEKDEMLGSPSKKSKK